MFIQSNAKNYDQNAEYFMCYNTAETRLWQRGCFVWKLKKMHVRLQCSVYRLENIYLFK